MAQKLRFIKEYGELETAKPGYYAEASGETVEKSVGDRGGSRKYLYHQFSCFFCFFGVGGDFEILITISQ